MCYAWLAFMIYFGMTDSYLSLVVLNLFVVVLFPVYRFMCQTIHFLIVIGPDLADIRKRSQLVTEAMFMYSLRPTFEEVSNEQQS